MKFSSVLKILFSLFITEVFFACSNINGMDDYTEERKSNSLTVIASSNNQINFGSSSRSILPSAIDTKTLKFYLWGTDKLLNSDYKIKKITFSPSLKNQNEGFADIDIKKGVYELNLVATQSDITIENFSNEAAIDEVMNAAWFYSSISADLRYLDSVKFLLMPCTSNGTGQALLKLYTSWDWPTGLTTDCGIYNMVTDNPVWHSENCITEAKHSLPENPNFNTADVAPGVYNLKITFITAEGKKFTYSDLLTIFSNQITTATLEVPNIIEKFPSAAPSNLTAAYAPPTYDDDNYYYAQFCWDDNSNNEQYFQLELLDITALDYSLDSNAANYNADISTVLAAAGGSATDSAWDAVKDTLGVKSYAYNPDNYGDSSVENFKYLNGDGALLPSNQYIVYKFAFDKRYLARLCAVTARGNSDYAYLDFSSSRELESTNLSASFTKFNQAAASLNLYKITYNYDGGNFKDASTTIPFPRCAYNSQLSPYASQPQIIYPINYEYDSTDSSKKATLKKNGYAWESWTLNGIRTDDVIEFTENAGVYSYEYSGFSSLNLYANYPAEAEQAETGLVVNSDVLVAKGNGDESVVASAISLEISDSTTLSSAGSALFTAPADPNYPYLYFYAADDNSGDRYNVEKSFLTVQKNGRAVKTYSCAGGAAKNVSFTKALVFVVDASEFSCGGLYVATYTLLPNDSENPKYFTFLFTKE